MSEATSGEVRWGGEEREEEGGGERDSTQRASGPGGYSFPSRCAEALEAILGILLNKKQKSTASHPFMSPGVLVVLLQAGWQRGRWLFQV